MNRKRKKPDFKEWWKTKSPAQRLALAEAAGTSQKYIEVHLLRRTRVPSRKIMVGIANASNGDLTLMDMLNFCYFVDDWIASAT